MQFIVEIAGKAKSYACLLLVLLLAGCSSARVPQSSLLDLDAPSLAAELASGNVSAETVTLEVLARIQALDDSGPRLNATIEINPDALELARALDARFRQSGISGPLHGVPVVLKANIDTGDRMVTSAGSLALANNHAVDDAELVTQLREAGAVIVAKANLSEWANFRDNRSSSGLSSLGGQTRNPYILDRNPCGSSSGSAVAVAASIVPLAVGTEIGGSIVCPAGANGVVGIKPTFGTVSQDGIVPIAHSRDIAGPMARTVRGAAMMLTVMQGLPPYNLERDDLSGLRIGSIADYSGAGISPEVDTLFNQWQDQLASAGAFIPESLRLDIPTSINQANFQVMLYEFKADLNSYS